MNRLLHIAIMLAILVTLPLISMEYTQAQAVKVVKFDIRPLTVYRGYQFIEIVAYFNGAPSLVSAYARLTSGISVAMNLTTLTLSEPITVTVGNVTYTVPVIALIRLPVPEAMIPGRAVLEVVVRGSNFVNTTRVTVSILDHRPISDLKNSVYVGLANLETLISVAEALGVDTSKIKPIVADLERRFDEATKSLEMLGDVDGAVASYTSIQSNITTLQSSIVSAIAASQRYALTSLRNDIVSYVSSNLENIVKDYNSKISNIVNDYNNKFNLTIQSIMKIVSDSLNSVVNDYSGKLNKIASDTSSSLQGLSNTISKLDSELSKLAQSQEELSRRTSETLNAIQIAILVLAIVVAANAVLSILILRRK